MTLKQLKYIVTVADTGSVTEAAKRLFIAQPSLTSAIHEIENEYNLTIFYRSNKGIKLTPEGDEFLGYARQVLEQASLIDERYTGKSSLKQKFSVSAQHYSFVVEAFVELVKQYDGEKYEFHMRETETFDIINDVAHLNSEIGVLYMNRFNETVMKTSTGALNHVNIIMVTNLPNTIEKLKDMGYYIYAAEADGVDYRKVDYADKKVLVVGSEGFGLSRLVRKNSDEIISLPMNGVINSLNASVAAGILIYGIGD